MQLALAIGLFLFFALMVGISLWARKKIHTGEDFIVAGRGLSGIMTTATIMATWYAAETILVTADWVRTDGIDVTVLEPLGIGICLIIAGAFFARKLWNTKLLTVADVIKSRFGTKAEKLQAFISINYIGWVAVQLIGLAGVLNVYFGLALPTGIVILAVVLTAYTLMGGMWSVALTDIFQLGMLLVGMVILTFRVLGELGEGPISGLAALFDRLDAHLLEFIPNDSTESLTTWFGLIALGLFANIATQDLVQRMLSARSGKTAQKSCIAAGLLYIIFGTLPVLLGLSGTLLLDPSLAQGVIPALAEQLLSPTIAVIFALTLTAAVTSSVDSGLLAPASVLARNVLGPMLKDRIELVTLTRICVVLVAIGSCSLALSGTRASELIQGTYALSIPPLVLLTAALYQKETHPLPAILTLGTGIALWLYQMVGAIRAGDPEADILSPGFPLILLVLSFVIYGVSDWLVKRFGGTVSSIA
jgi:SSS family solute:Na+ symporter